MSDDGAGDVELALRIARQWPVARLSVSRPPREPFAIPLVQVVIGDRIWSPIDGKPKRSAQEPLRLRLLRANPQATLLFDDYQDDWSQLWWVRLTVEAVVVALDGDDPRNELERSFRSKYPQYRHTPLFVTPSSAIRFTVTDVSIWAAGGRAALESRFSRTHT